MTIHYFHNTNHLGDSIMNLRFFYNNSELLRLSNIKIVYYYSVYTSKFLNELYAYVDPTTVELQPMSQKHDESIELWMGNSIGKVDRFTFSAYYDLFYKAIQKHLLLDSMPLDCNFWQAEPQLEGIYTTLPPCYKDIDIVIVNSEAFSGQYRRHPDEMNQLCEFLSKRYRIVTTQKVGNLPCTTDHGLQLKDIGALTTHAKYVVAVMTGPICAMYTKESQASVKKWFIITTDGNVYAHTGIIYELINNGDLTSIYTFFNS